MIQLKGLCKRFGARAAVDDLTLDVPAGSVFGLLGHNGSGKSTTLGMILGQVLPDRGRVTIDGIDALGNRSVALRRVGAIFETPAFYDYLSGLTNLHIFCEYSARADAKQIAEVVELVDLSDRIHEPVGVYSHGMRQRLALAQALLPRPRLLILDEPADGLDPEGIHEMRQLVRRLNREWNLTILFSSHQLSEVERLCDRVAVLRHGRRVFDGPWPPPQIETGWVRFTADRQDDAIAALQGSGLVRRITEDGRVQLAADRDAAALNRFLLERGFAVGALEPLKLTLEDFYLHYADGRERL